MENTKILIGLLVGVVIIGTTYLLYLTGDTIYLPRFVVYSEGYIGAVIIWLGLNNKQPKETIDMEAMRT